MSNNHHVTPRQDTHIRRKALEKDDWRITHDPLILAYQGTPLRADIWAERSLAAEKAGRKIAVEIKDFDKAAVVRDLEKTVGQLQFYQWVWMRKTRNVNYS